MDKSPLEEVLSNAKYFLTPHQAYLVAYFKYNRAPDAETRRLHDDAKLAGHLRTAIKQAEYSREYYKAKVTKKETT